MGRIHYHDGVELEADIRPRSDIPNAGEEQSGDDLLIRRSLMNALSNLLEQFRLRCVFDKPDQRLDSGTEPHQCRSHSRFLRGYGRHILEERKTSSTDPGDFQKLAACRFVLHNVLL